MLETFDFLILQVLGVGLFLSKAPSESLDFAGHLRLDTLDLLVLSLPPHLVQISQHLVHHRFRNIASALVSEVVRDFISVLRDPIFLLSSCWSNLGRGSWSNRVHESNVARVDC